MEAEFITAVTNVVSVLFVGFIVSVVDPYIVTRMNPQTPLEL